MKFRSCTPFAAIFAIACGSSSGGNEPTGPAPSPTSTSIASSDPCGLNSGFKGDELCVAPPAVGEGIQLHVGPTSYDDAAATEQYVIQPGEENVRCFLTRPSESGFYYFKQQNRMRSGSHHMLINLIPDQGQAEGPTTACEFAGGIMGSIPGSQTPSRDFPGAELGPEDEGLARYVPPGTMVSFQMHYVNNQNVTLLREAWVNLYKMDEADVKQKLQSVFIVGDFSVNVPPQTRQTTTELFSPNLTDATRVFQLNGHSHAHTETFTVYRIRGTERDLVYQSFNWAEPDVLTFNSVVTNSPPDPAAKKDGGMSGPLMIQPGDQLEWSCDVNNTTDAALRFANEAYTAEMCLLAGSYVSNTPRLLTGGCSAGSCFSGTPPNTN
jgi:hypothetical protein